ncbi:MAG: sigma-70 family RNA polymerase sigma factor [Betaproteobacteria bacterium]|nr:sigma-70 family RNA polymerase sigma factor [Betaproteobacteria bacterium]MBI2960750.1 sigma-70 family RNA polymerase sigma factor [Betaproteobacteria bacterium]
MLASDSPDEDWVRRAQAGDRRAFSELVQRHQDRVYRYLLRMLGSHDDALELTQDAFIKAWQALPQWQPKAQFRTWLFRIANNTALDALRRRKLVEFVPLEDSFDAPGSEPDPERQAPNPPRLPINIEAIARPFLSHGHSNSTVTGR